MRDMDVGPIPVCDGDRLLGMLTDRDIAIRAVAEDGRDPREVAVANVMTPDVIYCFDDQDVEEAARIMQERQIRRLLVLNREKQLVGIVSLGDVAVENTNPQTKAETLKKVSEPAEPQRAAA
jgi:CBS domain-containing protein